MEAVAKLVNAGIDQPVVVGSTPTGFPMLKNRIKALKDRPQIITRPELLLLPQIPQPMHGLAPRVILGKQWWDKIRKEAYRKLWFHCMACGTHKSEVKGNSKWLDAHEKYDINYTIGRTYFVEAVPLCPFCHAFIHSGRLQALLDKRQITQQRFAAIIRHGEQVLARAGLVKPPPYDGPMAEWENWRLVIGRKMYRPKYRSVEDWARHFDNLVEE